MLNGLESLPSATPKELLSVALYLHSLTMQSSEMSADIKAKLYPQFNREKSLFAYAVNRLFGGKRDLNEEEIKQAREFVRPLNEGFKQLFGAIVDGDVYLKAKIDTPSYFNSKLFFETSNKVISDEQGNMYQIGLKRFEVTNKTGAKIWATNIVFVPLRNQPIAAPIVQAMGMPAATQPKIQSFMPVEAIANGVIPVQANGYAPSSL